MVTKTKRQRARRLPSEDRIDAIVLAAREVFESKGYEGASTAEIATRAGVVEGTIYRYFDTKLDLLIKVVGIWYEAMLADYAEQLAGIRGTWNRLRFIIWWQLKIVHNDPRMSSLIYYELRQRPEYRNTTLFKLNREYTRRTVGIIAEAMESGEFRPNLKLRLLRDMIHGAVEHSAWDYMHGLGDFSPDELADMITDVLFQGLRSPTAPPVNDELLAASVLESVTRRLEDLSGRLDRRLGESQGTAKPKR